MFLRSKTCRSLFAGLTTRKQREMMSELANELESMPQQSADGAGALALRHTLLQELTRQPYTGHFLTFMLFDEAAHVEGLDELLEAALKNCFDVDIIEYMNLEEIYDAT